MFLSRPPDTVTLRARLHHIWCLGCVRAGSNEDDLTIALGEIVHTNTQIKIAISKGGVTSKVAENWDFLQQQVARYLNSDMPGFPKHLLQGLKPLRALTQRLKVAATLCLLHTYVFVPPGQHASLWCVCL